MRSRSTSRASACWRFVWLAKARATFPWIAAAAIAIGLFVLATRGERQGAQCDAGFVVAAARCMSTRDACPSPLVVAFGECDAPDTRVLVPAARFHIGPSDWEAEGRVPPREVATRAFYMDAFEVTIAKYGAASASTTRTQRDAARAVDGITRAEAIAYCAARGGRLPTEDEWIAAASSGAPTGTPTRYPWGDTGAVCRRAAWGLARGPCSQRGDGPDTVGAHSSGDTPLGLHDMAGNVAEWIAPDDARDLGIARGGSWQSDLATELRIWSRLEVAPGARDARIGMRCVYDVAP
jgi:formylglycine-generating enzyme required for sulfatase activity